MKLRLIALSVLTPLLFSLSTLAASLIEPGAKLELISSDFGLADGPSWNGSALIIPDVKGEKVVRYNPKSKKFDVLLPKAGRISASYFNNGRLYLSDNANCRIVSVEAGNTIQAIAGHDPQAKQPARPNDLVVDDRGGIYYTLTRQGQVVYIDPQGKQSVAIEGIETPNGIALSPDQKTLYVSAAAPKKVWAYALKAPGKAGPGSLFASMDSGPERGADGMTMDRAGNVYCTGPKHVWIWSPSGQLIETIETPERPINCVFGDSDMRSLYITGFGGLYRIRMNAYGLSQNQPFQAAYQTNQETRPSTVIPNHIESHLNVVYAQDGDRKLLLDVFRPKGNKKLPGILVVHGGGWLNGSKNKFQALAIELANRGYVTAAIEYRLGHEAKFPAGIHDCNAATRFLKANAATYGIDPKRIGAVGGSAGGHLVGLMATGWENKKLQGNGGNPQQSSRLDVAIVMAGPMEMTTGSVAERSRQPKSGSNSNIWLGKTIDEAPKLYALADAHLQISKKDPPLYFMVGELDNPQRNQPSRDKLASLGIPTGVEIYKDGPHGCWNRHPWFSPMIDDMVAIFKKRL